MQIQTDRYQKELKHHGDTAFPLLVSYERLSRYETGSFLWHWHPEIELTLVTRGEILYRVNHASYHLRAGDTLFGNMNTLHTGAMVQGQDCEYTSVTFDPRLIYGFPHSLIGQDFVNPVTQNPALSAIHFDGSEPWHEDIIASVRALIECWESGSSASDTSVRAVSDVPQNGIPESSSSGTSAHAVSDVPQNGVPESSSSGTSANAVSDVPQNGVPGDSASGAPGCRELDLLIKLLQFWKILYVHTASPGPGSLHETADYQRIKDILAYLDQHFAEKISLADISSHIHLCESECSRLFRRCMNVSLFTFLQEYRIDRSLELLADPAVTITEAAQRTGFSDSNYFSKVFIRQKGCSPREYRRRLRDARA